MNKLIIEKSKISKGYQVIVPSKIRKLLKLKPGDILIWTVIDEKIVVDVIRDNAEEILKILGKVDMGSTNAAEDIDIVVNESE